MQEMEKIIRALIALICLIASCGGGMLAFLTLVHREKERGGRND